jgi:hypothetical protein
VYNQCTNLRLAGKSTFVHQPRIQLPTTRLRINLANCTLSATALITRGDGVLMSSLASLTAAMIDAEMASVDVNLS